MHGANRRRQSPIAKIRKSNKNESNHDRLAAENACKTRLSFLFIR
ncbi:hypothetical protein CPter91_3927 [Collimonas pratensis]|uniref:Uncharacterized protein n=1 Tax=Collimonas pratensis TaxID=279113 RepID=A0A127Q879_9BURK|nr:hypothetical protein CPter91_3927 [Collimonas pratensis]